MRGQLRALAVTGKLRLLVTFAFAQHLLQLAGVLAAPWTAANSPRNLNQNQAGTTDPLQYSGKWEGHSFNPSPDNWRAVPFYSLLLDRFADGDPTNNDASGTPFETDPLETTFRHGGDAQGIIDRIPYLSALGAKGVYIAGTIFENLPWDSHGYNALDFTLVDAHGGTIDQWRALSDALHARGMYLMLDVTVGTLGDLIYSEGYLNKSAPFNLKGYRSFYKNPLLTYADFHIDNTWNATCELPRFWGEDGLPLVVEHKGCYNSDFDQFGSVEAFGVHPPWQRQLAKFNDVQDRLRDWSDPVAEKSIKFACLLIQQLDIDALRIDKATQMSLDFVARFAKAMRACAAEVGKTNFFITGEVTGGGDFGAVFVGRGRQPDQRPSSMSNAVTATGSESYYIRDVASNAIDSVAYHYSIYRALTRLLGMQGNLEVAYDLDTDFVTAWNQMLTADDMLNPSTMQFDPRHMYGMTNHDIFRWPSLVNGIEKLHLGLFVTNLLLPGIPLVYYGEEQQLYLLDTYSSNYMYGRQPMTSNLAWKMHGCFRGTSDQYPYMPWGKVRDGCNDDKVSLDHSDVTNPSFLYVARLFALRAAYPVLQDGMSLVSLGTWTQPVVLEGNSGVPTNYGVWSTVRGVLPGQPNAAKVADKKAWFLYSNQGQSVTVTQPCDGQNAMLAPYAAGTSVTNLIYPYETYVLGASTTALNPGDPLTMAGCLPSLTLRPWGMRLYVPTADVVPLAPTLITASPGHDERIESTGAGFDLSLSLHFSEEMDCGSVTADLAVSINVPGASAPTVDPFSVVCQVLPAQPDPDWAGVPVATWSWSAKVRWAPDGHYQLTLGGKATATASKLAMSRVINHSFRVGSAKNPYVFPQTNALSTTLLQVDRSGVPFLSHSAVGADSFRYSTDFGRTWSPWQSYSATPQQLPKNTASVVVNYWSRWAGSAAHVVHGSLASASPRNFGALQLSGEFNSWGTDGGIANQMNLDSNSTWELPVSYFWPSALQVTSHNDESFLYGDLDQDGVLDRISPGNQAPNAVNFSAPPAPYLTWKVRISDSSRRYWVTPVGSYSTGAVLLGVLALGPVILAYIGVTAFRFQRYKVRFNQVGRERDSFFQKAVKKAGSREDMLVVDSSILVPSLNVVRNASSTTLSSLDTGPRTRGLGADAASAPAEDAVVLSQPNAGRLKILMATMEYDIPVWKIKVRIGGLGVVANLMAQRMTDNDIVWVIPKVKDVDYPEAEHSESIHVTILGRVFEVDVDVLQQNHVKFVLLDAGVFRGRTTKEPYPPRMDDLESAVYYSAWNQCIAEVIRRENVDLYHINDYHGAVAPLYLLPRTIPVVLVLHNAEFQGLWPMRNGKEDHQVCSAFDISKHVARQYIKYGTTFNMLHAAASYIRLHQRGVGVVGVSDRYGGRSWARYPVLWGLPVVHGLANPNPSDIGETAIFREQDAVEDAAGRAARKLEAQAWAGLTQDATADLIVFVGRWSKQKGLDLIADLLPSVLSQYPKAQVIAVGPIIDAHGHLASIKLARLMTLFPGRVYSKPEFTMVPKSVFESCDFVFIPSRDEPFGLVAVEFGRYGALGIGSFVGGLGSMPGWWFPIESSETTHLVNQFKKSIRAALDCPPDKRAKLRQAARQQRFPVEEWLQKMNLLYRNALRAVITAKRLKSSAVPTIEPSAEAGPNVGQEAPAESQDDLAPDPEGIEQVNRVMDGNPSQSPTVAEQRQTVNFTLGNDDDSITTADSPSENSITLATNPNVQHSDPAEEAGREATAEEQANSLSTRYQLRASFMPLPTAMKRVSSSAMLNVQAIQAYKDFVTTESAVDFEGQKDELATEYETRIKALDVKALQKSQLIDDYITKREQAFHKQAKKATQRPASLNTQDPAALEASPPTASQMTASVYANQTGDIPAPLTRTARLLRRQIGGWYLYSILFALGQLLSATAFQLVLFSHRASAEDNMVYSVSTCFIIGTLCWWLLYTTCSARTVLALPFAVYALALVAVGIPRFFDQDGRDWSLLNNIAMWIYAFASGSGSFYFALNFGEEAGSSTRVWIMRASFVDGLRLLWISLLYYWAYTITRVVPRGTVVANVPLAIVLICWIGAAVLFAIATILFTSLPSYYTTRSPSIPNFVNFLLRRKVVQWWLISEVFRNFWLSPSYGRNWIYLWRAPLPDWGTFVLIFGFFVLVWWAVMMLMYKNSGVHSWYLPILGCALGAPRWAQMIWAMSGVAWAVPFFGAAGPWVGVGVWLWLGVLDAVQMTGMGMILLQTLTRVHVLATLVIAQVLGAGVVMLSKGVAPNRVSPSPVFPDFATWDWKAGAGPLASWEFWVCLVMQIAIPVGMIVFFRNEQLTKA
ncbi:glycoside hydrolase family 13 and glycosyltransferase family 5 protein [Geranomyces variabilis]|nr:glycoside hydrolase family 13 and glycosyltransferase family 5 protein [Geranomyces variabilis]KAJ3131682.1 Cell wall alpha-1,3-glucan synthase ags1 [Geranomyces variabilis]